MAETQIRTVIFSKGERYPVLVDGSGVPGWFPTLFVTTQVRNTSNAPNTMVSVLGAVKLLLAWAEEHFIDLEQRFRKRLWLTGTEIESIRNYFQRRGQANDHRGQVVVSLPRRMESARAVVLAAGQRVSPWTVYIRMTYIAKYLEWLADRMLERDTSPSVALARNDVKAMLADIRSRRPNVSKHSRVSTRRGLGNQARSTLLEMMRPDAPNNPFGPTVRLRNWVIVRLLDALGIRAGELLAMKVMDFDFQRNEVLIPRRHGDPHDPRSRQPVAKTLDRRLALTDELSRLVHRYVMTDRNEVRLAKRHPFLLITHQGGSNCGAPLSYSALSKIFRQMRSVIPAELEGLSAHVLRHTTNDRLSEQWDAEGVSDAKEEKMRSYMMGWREGSGTAAIYTRRHTERKAREAQLKLQRRVRDKEEGTS